MSEGSGPPTAYACRTRDGVLQVSAPDHRFLSTGWDGGYQTADAAYNISVPGGWDRTDLTTYIAERRREAAFDTPGPALLTGVEMKHAVGAWLDGVTAIATVGLSNPASLPLMPQGVPQVETHDDGRPERGTVNLIVGTDRALDESALATLLTVVVEAKTATLQQLTDFTGTTSDAVIVGSDRSGESNTFAGSATPVGNATRAAVRDAIRNSLASRYAERPLPRSVGDAESGIETNSRAEIFLP